MKLLLMKMQMVLIMPIANGDDFDDDNDAHLDC